MKGYRPFLRVMETPHSYILLNIDKPFWQRGQLLKLAEDGFYAHTHAGVAPEKTEHEPCFLSADDVAPLTKEECALLGGIKDYAICNTAYCTPGRLAWGLTFKVGGAVLARLPADESGHGSSAGGQEIYTPAIIRWAGPSHVSAHKFGK